MHCKKKLKNRTRTEPYGFYTIRTLDAQSQDGFYAISMLDVPFQDGFLLKTTQAGLFPVVGMPIIIGLYADGMQRLHLTSRTSYITTYVAVNIHSVGSNGAVLLINSNILIT